MTKNANYNWSVTDNLLLKTTNLSYWYFDENNAICGLFLHTSEKMGKSTFFREHFILSFAK